MFYDYGQHLEDTAYSRAKKLSESTHGLKMPEALKIIAEGDNVRPMPFFRVVWTRLECNNGMTLKG